MGKNPVLCETHLGQDKFPSAARAMRNPRLLVHLVSYRQLNSGNSSFPILRAFAAVRRACMRRSLTSETSPCRIEQIRSAFRFPSSPTQSLASVARRFAPHFHSRSRPCSSKVRWLDRLCSFARRRLGATCRTRAQVMRCTSLQASRRDGFAANRAKATVRGTQPWRSI